MDFLTKKTKVNEGEIPQYYVEENHEAIISPDVFAMVQREMAKRGRGKDYHSSVHTFSSQIRCGQCGCWYGSKVWHSNSKYRKTVWQCNHKFDNDEHCTTPHLTDNDAMLMFTLRCLMDGKPMEAQRYYSNIHPDGSNNLIDWWLSKKEDAEKRTIIETCTEKLPKLKLALQPGPDGKIMLLPEVNSVIDAAYYALARFMAVNTGALED